MTCRDDHGSGLNIDRLDHLLIESVLQQGLARPDSLGLEVTLDFQLVGADGTTVKGLTALGPIARGSFWDANAVPELRAQCARAGTILAEQLTAATA